MDIDKAIKNRRSIRKYKTDELSKEQILEILDAGNRAPSAKNRVQWRFHVFQREAKKRLIQTCNEALDEIQNMPLMTSARNSFKIMDQAPVVIIVVQTREWGGLSPEIQSVSAAIQNMLLKAHGMGLGTVWINDVLFVEKEIMKILDYEEIDSEMKNKLLEASKRTGIEIGISGPLIAAIALGYPDENPKREPRFNLEEVTTWYDK
jgi:nitroreductase